MPVSIPESVAVWKAIEACSVAMRAQFETSVNAAAAEIISDPEALERLPLPTPTAQEYHYALNRSEIDRVIKNSNLAVFIHQGKPSTQLQERSLIPPNNQDISQLTFIEILIVYRIRNAKPIELLGKTFTPADIMSLRGYIYAGGIMDCVRQFASNGDSISLVQTKDSDFAGAVRFDPTGNPVIGVATVSWGMRQDLSKPLCKPLPT